MVLLPPKGNILMDFFTLLLPADKLDLLKWKIPRKKIKAALEIFQKICDFLFFY